MEKPVCIDGKYYVELLSYGETHGLGHCGEAMKEYFKHKPISILEVGVLRGHHAEAISKNFNINPLVLVDPWDFCKETHPNNWADVWFRIQGNKDVIVIKATSEEARFLIPWKFDWIYLDGEHTGGDLSPGTEFTGIRRDISLWISSVKPGGVISGHDYNYDNIKHEVDKVFGDKVCSSPYHPHGGMEWWVFVNP